MRSLSKIDVCYKQIAVEPKTVSHTNKLEIDTPRDADQNH